MRLLVILSTLLGLNSPCIAQISAKCYYDNIHSIINSSEVEGDGTAACMLIYDAKLRRFLFKAPGSELQFLSRLEQFNIRYKRPFQLKIVNLNRYLYNVNLGNSDVTFTSNQSEFMQKYLFPGSSKEPPPVPNTHSDGLSANQGDPIFGLLTNFKPEVDRLFILLRTIRLNFESIAGQSQKALRSYESLNTVIRKEIKSQRNKSKVGNAGLLLAIRDLNNYNQELDFLAITLQKFIKQINNAGSVAEKDYLYTEKYVPGYNQFKEKADGIVKQIQNSNSPSLKKLSNSENFTRFAKNVNELANIPKTLITSADPNTPVSSDSLEGNDTTLNKLRLVSANLLKSFEDLENYYNNFVDTKISVYSQSTSKFQSDTALSTLTYAHFNSLLTDINQAYASLREAAMEIKEDATTNSDAPMPTSKSPDIMKVTASDITFDKDGKVVGVKLSQSGDVPKSQPVQATRPAPGSKAELLLQLDSVGTLWIAFERSISPEFIMRRILFKKNIVEENMTYTSPPIYPYGDRMRLVLQIVASDSAKKNGVILDDMTTESLDFRVRGKAQFSFSAGTFFALGRKMRNSTYEYRQVPMQGANLIDSNSPHKLVSTGKGSIPIGASAQANITGSIGNGIRLGGSIGVAVAAEPNIRLGYLGGLTASVGNFHQFHFSAGVVAMTVDELKDNYKTSTALYTTVPAGSVYTQKVKPGLFFSFSYTVFNVKASGNGKAGLINQTGIMVK